MIPVALALAADAAVAASPARPAVAVAITPALLEVGQTRDGLVTYVAHGLAPASVGSLSLAGDLRGDFSFRVSGLCLESSEASLVPAGVSGNTTSWSYFLSDVRVELAEDAPKGSCKYTARVTYGLSVTGAVTVNQMAYTVYLKGRAAAGAAGGLSVVP